MYFKNLNEVQNFLKVNEVVLEKSVESLLADDGITFSVRPRVVQIL